MGQNIGTCITAILSCIGAKKNARRAAIVHLSFNVIGTIVCLTVFWIVKVVVSPAILGESATMAGIAVCHSVFNILCTAMLLPASSLLEKLAHKLVPDGKEKEQEIQMDERLFTTPFLALVRCREVAAEMARCAMGCMRDAIAALDHYTPELAERVRAGEERSDKYEDVLGSYLVKLSALQISEQDSAEAGMLLKAIGDFERISDHSVNVLGSVEELLEKKITLSEQARAELRMLTDAVLEIMELSLQAFTDGSEAVLTDIETLEQVIDELKEKLRSRHIQRLQQGDCTMEVGFVWSDLLTNLERTSDHCSNVAGGLLDLHIHNMNMHENLRVFKADEATYQEKLELYQKKYALPQT